MTISKDEARRLFDEQDQEGPKILSLVDELQEVDTDTDKGYARFEELEQSVRERPGAAAWAVSDLIQRAITSLYQAQHLINMIATEHALHWRQKSEQEGAG